MDEKMEQLLARFVRAAAETLGGNLLGVYLHGSAAMECFQPKKSDLDLLLVVREDMPEEVKRRFMDCLLELDAEGPAKVIEMSIVTRSVCDPFVYPTPFVLHYSRMHRDWYRRDPEDYVRRMNGMDADLAAHFTVIRARGRCLYGLPVREAFSEVPAADYLDSIRSDVSGAVEEIGDNPMYLILNLARVLAYQQEGKVLSKREGGRWALEHLPERFHSLIASALREYETGEETAYDPEQSKAYASGMLRRIIGA